MNFLVVVLVACLGATGDAAPSDPHSGGKIINGATAAPGEFPYMASLRNVYYGHICGGAIINKYWVLSAAHCYYTVDGKTFIQNVGVGSNTLTKQIIYPVENVYMHPTYDGIEALNDVLLVKTSKVITLIPQVVATIPINTVGTDDFTLYTNMRLAGWGWVADWTPPNNLMAVTYVNQARAVCYQKNYKPDSFSPEIQMCAQATSTNTLPSGACFGDSGGPLVVNGKVFGITSKLMGLTCASGIPDIFTRVSFYSTWINNIIANY